LRFKANRNAGVEVDRETRRLNNPGTGAFIGETAPGQAGGDDISLNGGLHEVLASQRWHGANCSLS
jgi:hypothetical protein